jgi:hypothetical protein
LYKLLMSIFLSFLLGYICCTGGVTVTISNKLTLYID